MQLPTGFCGCRVRSDNATLTKMMSTEEKADGGMKHIVSEAQRTSELFFHGRFRKLFLRSTCFVGLFLALTCIFSSGSQFALASSQSALRPVPPNSSTQPLETTFSHADIVFVIDNVGDISTYDPTGARFIAAQMFVNQAQFGSSIGVVKVTSSNKAAVLLNLTPIKTSNDKTTVRKALKQSLFGFVDPSPVAYFVPALQAASQMFLPVQANDHKYIVLMTGSLAQSGDIESCSSTPDQFHQWFCEIPTLKSENISVILFGFTTPSNQSIPSSTQQYLQRYGGMAVQVG